jgi:hypothetical protein
VIWDIFLEELEGIYYSKIENMGSRSARLKNWEIWTGNLRFIFTWTLLASISKPHESPFSSCNQGCGLISDEEICLFTGNSSCQPSPTSVPEINRNSSPIFGNWNVTNIAGCGQPLVQMPAQKSWQSLKRNTLGTPWKRQTAISAITGAMVCSAAKSWRWVTHSINCPTAALAHSPAQS